MNLSRLLGKQLKDESILEVLEAYGMQVIYDFDRTHENMEDKYWAQAQPYGFQLGCNQNQKLEVIFCYIGASEGFSPIDENIIGVPVYRTFEDAENTCKRESLRYRVSDSKSPGWWIRIEGEHLWSHYQFKDKRLFRVSLSQPK